MSTEPDAIVTATPKHIESVRTKIEEIKKRIAGQFVDLGELLGEIKEGGYFVTWGFQNFGLWLKQSGLDLGESQAYYLIKIVRTAKELDIPRDQLEQVKLSKLREICRLDPKTHGKQIKQLVDACTPNDKGEEMSLEDVRINVQKVEAGVKDGEETKIDLFVFMTIKVTQSAKQVIEDAVELIRAKHGDTVNGDGEPVEISIGKAIELMAAETLNGVDEVEPEDENVPTEGQPLLTEGTRVDLTGEDVAEYHVESLEDATLPEHSGEVLRVMPTLDEAVEAVTEVALQPVVLPEVIDVDTTTDGQQALIEQMSVHNPPPPFDNVHVMPIDILSVEKRVTADLAASQGTDEDPLLEDVRRYAKEEFDEFTSQAVGALALTRKYRIGAARALNLFTAATAK